MPPGNSRPPSAAASEAVSRAARSQKSSTASAALGSADSSNTRMSPLIPDTPSRPDSRVSSVSTAAGDNPSRSTRCKTAPGSMLPHRVAIARPSKGVKPIVVAMLRPARTPHRLAPAPRCAITARSGTPPVTSASRATTDS